MRFYILAVFLTVLSLSAHAETKPAKQAASAEQTSLGTFNGWRAYSFKEGGNTVCYMTLPAVAPAGKHASGRITITHRPVDGTKDTFSYTGGYAFKSGSTVEVAIGKAHADLFTDKDTAWARDTSTDHALATAIRGGSNLSLTGTPAKGGATTDKFDLKGADQAYHATAKACGIAVDALPSAPKKAKPAAKPAAGAAPKKVNAPAAKH